MPKVKKRKRTSATDVAKRMTAINDAYRSGNHKEKVDLTDPVTIHVEDITIVLDWDKATAIGDDMEYDAISVSSLYAELVILSAKARKWSDRLASDKVDAYGQAFKSAKETEKERRITDKEAEATAKANEDYLMVLEEVEDAEFAVRVTEGLMRALNIKAETLRTLLLKAPTI